MAGADNVDPGRSCLGPIDPELHRFILAFVYEELYVSEVMNPRTRALSTVAMLATLGRQL